MCVFQEVPSDDDYQEEDNDYIQSYFDNGENYGEVGSDDNLDDDNAFWLTDFFLLETFDFVYS